jgi:hypothetical protein
MPVTAMEQTIKEILADTHLRRNRKIDRLRELRSDARGIQRESCVGMTGIDDGLQDDLRVIETALKQLGAEIEEKGAATL